MSFGDVKHLKIVSDTSHFVETWGEVPSATIDGSINSSIDPANGNAFVTSSLIEIKDVIWASWDTRSTTGF